MVSLQDWFLGQYYLVSFNSLDDGQKFDLSRCDTKLLDILAGSHHSVGPGEMVCQEEPFGVQWSVKSCTSDGVAPCSSAGWLEDRFPGKDLGLRWRKVECGWQKPVAHWAVLTRVQPEIVVLFLYSAILRPHLKYDVWGSPINEKNDTLTQVQVRITKDD